MTLAALALLPAVVLGNMDAAELEARFRIAAVPGVSFQLVEGEPLPAAPICAGRRGCSGPQPAWEINWGSAPDQVVAVRVPRGLSKDARVLLATERGDPLLLSRDRTVLVAVRTGGALGRWPYFNYLLHAAACDAVGRRAPPYATWSGSPMPQSRARWVFFGLGALLWLLVLRLYRRARRLGNQRTGAAAEFFAAIQQVASAGSGKGRGGTSKHQPGAAFARPLAGLLSLIGFMAFMAGVYLVLQWLLSNKVQPFPEADGLWRTTWDTLWVVWMLFDLGTGLALMKYFAEDRGSDPQTALCDVQFYIWWQLFARLAQGTAMGGIALGLLPRSSYAIYAPFVGLYASLGLPAFFPLGRMLSGALQRFDYQNLLDMAEQRVLIYLIPVPFALAGRWWGLRDPIYGEAFGAAVGLAIGHLASNATTLAIGLFALRKMGVPLGPIFLAQFDRKVAKRQLLFGAKIAIGADSVNLVKAVESLIVINALRDFTAWQGVRDLLARLNLLYAFGWSFYMSGIAAVSEAFSAGKRALTQYYVARYLQFGLLYTVTIFSVMMAIGPTFVDALGSQWSRAIPFLGLSLAGGLLSPTAGVSDALQQGAGRPWTFAIVLGIEQATRLALFIILVPRLQFWGILLGTVGALVLKAVVAWAVNHKTIVPLRLSVWATLVAPAVAGAMNYFVWVGVVRFFAPASPVAALLLFCVAAGLSFFICFFAYGLAGGCDRFALVEISAAAEMSTLIRPVARALSRAAHLGARIAPTSARPLALAEEAQAEADQLAAAAAVKA